MFKAAVGHSIDPDSTDAIEEVLEQCQETLGDDMPQAGIVIAAIDFEHAEILTRIQQTYPGIVLVGGTSVGEMSSAMAFQEDSLMVMLFCSDEVTFAAGLGQQMAQDATAATQQALEQATQQQDPADIKLCYTLAEGLGIDGVALAQGLQNSLKSATGHTVPIFGGLTADDWQLTRTYQFFGNEVLRDSVVVLTFSGNLIVSCGVATGQQPIGYKGTVTQSAGNTIYEIDDKPATAFYTNYFGEDKLDFMGGSSAAMALAVFEDQNQNFYVRSKSGAGETTGSLTFFGHVPEQSTVQFTDCDDDSILQAAKEAFEKANTAYSGSKPNTALMVSCASRMKKLGTRVKKEYSLAQNFLGTAIPSMGFYSFGEISPFSQQTKAHFHNETFTALLLGTE